MNTPPTQLEPSVRLAAQTPEPSPGAADLQWPDTEGPRPRILYADDDDSLRRLGERLLLCSGYAVDTVSDGAEAWAALQHTSYDLLVTDNEMPHLTGLELIRMSRQAGLNVPVILTSGTLATLPMDDLSWIECSAMLAKPFTCERLLVVVREALRAAASQPAPHAGGPPIGAPFPLPPPPRAIRWGINE